MLTLLFKMLLWRYHCLTTVKLMFSNITSTLSYGIENPKDKTMSIVTAINQDIGNITRKLSILNHWTISLEMKNITIKVLNRMFNSMRSVEKLVIIGLGPPNIPHGLVILPTSKFKIKKLSFRCPCNIKYAYFVDHC